MSEADDIEVVASGLALNKVSQWLGVSAEEVLQETDAAIDEMFEKPRPNLLGLGAKYLSHKSMDKSGLEMKLKHRLKKSVDDGPAAEYQPAQLDRYLRKRKHSNAGCAQAPKQAATQDGSDDDDEESGKLRALKSNSSKTQQQKKVFDRQQLLAVPVENLSKWQRKRMRQKAKQQEQQGGQ